MLPTKPGTMKEQQVITVGAAARRAGLSAKAVRLYEAHGLLEPAERTGSGYRSFSEHDINVLRFIRQAKALGLQLREIKDIIDLQRGGVQPCTKVLQLLDERIRGIDQTMAELRALRRTLSRARAEAKAGAERGNGSIICRIIESLPLTADSQREKDRVWPDERRDRDSRAGAAADGVRAGVRAARKAAEAAPGNRPGR